LNNNSFQEAAGLLTCDVPTIKAEAESSDSGFIIEGQAKFQYKCRAVKDLIDFGPLHEILLPK
jgi:hypothetical protein